MINRKGISPLIATVLLIAFTIAVGAIISVWITTFARSSAETQNQKGQTAQDCAGSSFSFTSSDVNVASGTVSIILTNEGSTNITALNLYAQLKNGTLYSNTTLDSSPRVNATTPLQQGQKIQLNSTRFGPVEMNGLANFSSLTITLGAIDSCAGKAYTVKF